jgi:hypothetical protein
MEKRTSDMKQEDRMLLVERGAMLPRNRGEGKYHPMQL